MAQRRKQFAWIVGGAAVLTLGAVAMTFAYGRPLLWRAAKEATAVLADKPVLSFVGWLSSTAALVFWLHPKNERHRILKDVRIAVVAALASWVGLFVLHIFFVSPLNLYDEARSNATKADERAKTADEARQKAEERAVKAEARASAVEARTPSSPPTLETPDLNKVAARQAHLESLRRALKVDVEQLAISGRELGAKGHRFAAVTPDDFKVNQASMWNSNVLMSDFMAHFPDYAAKRSKAQKDLADHDIDVRELVERVSRQLSWPKDPNANDERVKVARALVHRCSRNGFGMKVEAFKSGGYSYAYSEGGSGSNSGGAVPETLQAEWNAFRTYVISPEVKESCERASERADDLAKRFDALLQEAAMLAEVTALQGDCRYLRAPQ